MATFFATARFCTRKRNPSRWSGTVEARGIDTALSYVRAMIIRRHRGATKIDITLSAEVQRIQARPGERDARDASGSRPTGYCRRTIQLVLDIHILDEVRLRAFASNRMANAGFEPDPAIHATKPLGDLAFEALVGSNPDPVSPVDMGIEFIAWRDSTAG